MNLLNNKLVVLGILLFLSVLVVGVSIYAVYTVNNEFSDDVKFADLTLEEDESDENEDVSIIYVEVNGDSKLVTPECIKNNYFK